METPKVNSEEWWAERGVAEKVRAARRYVRWTTDDLEPVRAAYAGLTSSQQKTLLRWARQSDGLVIYRHSFERVPTGEFRYVYPEIRPDEAVSTKTTWHYHGPPLNERPHHPTTGKPPPPMRVHRPGSMIMHIARDRDPDDHRGANSDAVHSHRDMAKYLFPPGAKASVPWFHSHLDEYHARVLIHLVPMVDDDGEWYQPELTDERERLEARFAAWLEQHAGKYHSGMDAAGLLEEVREFGGNTQHEHSVRIKSGSEQLAKRIEINRIVCQQAGFEDAERGYFGIQGGIKPDLLLTAVRRANPT